MEKELPADWLNIAKRINSIAITGLTYCRDQYDIERYNELLDLSIHIINKITDIKTDKLQFIFNREIGYQTPKIGVRAVIFKDDMMLFVKEKMDGKWSLPGGFADMGLSPSEAVIREVKEESGYDCRIVRILGLIDYNKHQERPFPFDIYQLFIECEITGGKGTPGLETSEIGFFREENLPELSTKRVTLEQIKMLFEFNNDKVKQTIID
jgi:ADP-ribose pyrophosphatase YjhB (NUDIX family)